MTAPTFPAAPSFEIPRDRTERSHRTALLLQEAHACTDPIRRRELLDQVVVINRGVAKAVAARYRDRGVALEDLEQTAFEGLVKAVHRFDPTVRPDLLTYAVPTIRGELQRWFRDKSWTVRPPRRIQELQFQLNRMTEQLRQDLCREPSPSELAEAIGCDVEDLREAESCTGCFEPASLDRPLGDADGPTLGDMVPASVDHQEAAEARAMLEPRLRKLPERDRRILYLRFYEGWTQSEIGRELGVTQVQVSRLLTQIFERLHGELTSESASDPATDLAEVAAS